MRRILKIIMKKLVQKIRESRLSLIMLFIAPAATFYLLEWYTHNPFETMKTTPQVLNLVMFELLALLLFAVFGRLKVKNRIVITLTACVMTTLFGVLSSLIDTGLFTGFHENFWSRFAIIYVRGASFYITQIVCNAITFTLLFAPFTALLRKITPAKLLHINRRKTACRGEKTRENTLNCHIIK